MKKLARCAGPVLAAALLLGAPARAVQTTGAAFLDITPSARSYGLGMSPAITSLGAEALGANPANLGLMSDRFESFTSYATLLDGTQYEHVAASFAPADLRWIAAGVSVTRLQASDFQGADAQGNQTATSFGASDMAVTLGGAVKPAADVRVGLAVKAIQSELAGYRSNLALAGDLGMAYTIERFRQPLTIGASVTNFGQGIRFLEQTDPLPTTAHLGAAVPLGPLTLVVALNRSVVEQRTTFGTGLEFGVGPVSFRAGYLTQSQASNLAAQDQSGPARLLNGLSGGLGLRVGNASFDYAVSEQAVEFGPTQRVALSLRWGGSRPRPTYRFDPDRSDWQIRSLGTY